MLKFLFIVVYVALVAARQNHIVIDTSNGTYIGHQNNGYDTFFGVPYAKVDPANPFGKPLLYSNITKPHYGNDSSIMCPQVHYRVGGTLQCLRLNIYVPQNTNKKRAVLVWFPSHLRYGSAGDYGGQHLVKEGIIVVVANFRLGIYGFGCLNEPHIPANMALRDQDAALRWIKLNIEHFGGDPTAVTIGGQGYGGGMVDVHMYSDLDILFDKAIIQSGSMFGQGLFGPANPDAIVQVAKRLGKNVGKTTKPRDVINFLSKLNPIDVANATKALNIQWTICKEKHYKHGIKNFITKGPYGLEKRESVRSKKILIGYNSMELLGSFLHHNLTDFYKSVQNIFHQRLNQTFNLPEKQKEKLSKIVKKFYMGGKLISGADKIELIESGSDLFVNHAVEMSVDKFIDAGATVYKYLFSYTGGSKLSNLPRTGATSGEELKYLFEMDVKISGDAQINMRKQIIKYWANFVKFGNPTPDGKPILWTPVVGENRPYLNIKEKSIMSDHVFRERMAFLDLLFYVYQKDVKNQ